MKRHQTNKKGKAGSNNQAVETEIKRRQKALMKASRKLAKQELTINKLKTELKNVR